MSRRSPYEPIVYAVLILFGAFAGYLWSVWSSDGPVGRQSKIEQITNLLENQYVDSLDADQVEEDAIRSYLQSFDPHSVYIPTRFIDIANQELKGGFEGIGVEFFNLNDTPYVVRVLSGGPAEKAGLKAGDRLVKADTTELIGMKNTDIVQRLKGEGGDSVRLLVYRSYNRTVHAFDVVRGSITQPSVYSFLLDEKTAYFSIQHFAEPTHREFKEQLSELKGKARFDRVIIDLRNNPGGYLKTAIDLLDEFVDGNEQLAYTKGVNSKSKEFRAKPGGLCADMKLICLVNEHSASASEIFSGAIQDLDRGLVLGRRTYGKGLVQETFQLQDKSQVRLTVSRYYIPSGRSIQKPYNGEGYIEEDSNDLAHKEVYTTKGGREVKAGGGVMPDIELEFTSKFKDVKDVANVAAATLDNLYRKNLVQTSVRWEEWYNQKGVMEEVQTVDSISGLLRSRLCYQLFGPVAELESEVKDDAWIKRAMQEFDQNDLLINP